MCRALPGQVNCIRAGCSLPINVDKVTGIRHPFCSIACARACGENPRVPAIQATQPAAHIHKIVAAETSQVKARSEAKGSSVNVGLKKLTKNETAASHYVSPPTTDDDYGSAHSSDSDETLSAKH